MEPYVGLVLLGSLLFAVGNVMQKRGIPAWIGSHSVASLARRPGAMLGALVRSPVWLVGLALTAIALGVETQALGQGDVTVVKPLSRMQTVFVVGLAAGLLFGLGDVMVKAGTEIARGQAGHFDLTQASSAVALLETSQLHLGVLATLAAFLLQQGAFARGRVSVVVSAIGAGGMLVVVLLGVVLLHETLGRERIVAIVVVIAGAALLTPRDAPNHTAPHATGKT